MYSDLTRLFHSGGTLVLFMAMFNRFNFVAFTRKSNAFQGLFSAFFRNSCVTVLLCEKNPHPWTRAENFFVGFFFIKSKH